MINTLDSSPNENDPNHSHLVGHKKWEKGFLKNAQQTVLFFCENTKKKLAGTLEFVGVFCPFYQMTKDKNDPNQ